MLLPFTLAAEALTGHLPGDAASRDAGGAALGSVDIHVFKGDFLERGNLIRG
jgi:hypothetical protein